VSSHFTGMDAKVPYLVNLMLEIGEDPDMFGEAVIKEINDNIMKYLDQLTGTDINKDFKTKKTLTEYLKNALFLLDRLKNMTKEQRLAQIYSSKKSRSILEILHEKAYSRRELQNILEEKLGAFVSNIEGILVRVIDVIRQMDSFTKNKKQKLKAEKLLLSIENLREGKGEATVIIKDPMGNSTIVSQKSKKRELTSEEVKSLETGMVIFDLVNEKKK